MTPGAGADGSSRREPAWRREIALPRVRRASVWAALALTALVLILFHQAVFQGRVLYERDIHLNRYGQMESLVRAVSSGSWPVWDPYVSFGQPLLANPEIQVWYPLTWLNLIMPPWTYYTLFVVSHLIFSGIGLYLLCRRLGLSPAGALTAAALWVTSGPLLSLVNLYHHFAGATWIPWVLLAAQLATQSPTRARALAWGAAMAAQILAGSADMCAMTGGLLAILLLTKLRWRTPRDPINRRLLGCAAFAIVFALALSAAQWLPTLDIARHSARWELPERARTYFSVHPTALVQTLLPISLYDLPLRDELHGVLFERMREPLLRSLYLGLPAVALVAAAFCGPPRVPRRLIAGLAAGAVLLALGRHFAAYDLVIALVPWLRILRYPEKLMVVAALAWALLAGSGFDAWRAGRDTSCGRWSWRLQVPLLGGAGLGMVALLLALHPLPLLETVLAEPGVAAGPDAFLAPEAIRLATTLGLTLVVLALAIGRSRAAGSVWLPGAVALLCVLDLGLQHRELNPTAFKELFTYRPPFLKELTAGDGQRVYVVDYHVEGKGERFLGRADAYEMARYLPGWSARASGALAMRMSMIPPVAAGWGIESSYEQDVRGLYPRYLTALTDAVIALEGTPVHTRLLQIGAVGHVVSLHEKGFDGLRPVTSFDGLLADPTRVFEVPDPLPRSYAVSGVQVVRGHAAIERLLGASFDPTREIVLPEGSARSADPSFHGTSQVVERTADRVRLEAELNQPGYVVLVDGYDPGWRAEVDGQRVPVLRANVAFRAVPVPAGRHVIELVYRPPAVTWGAAITVIGLALGLGLTMLPARRGGAR